MSTICAYQQESVLSDPVTIEEENVVDGTSHSELTSIFPQDIPTPMQTLVNILVCVLSENGILRAQSSR